MSAFESCQFCRAQALRVEHLEEEVRQLREALAPSWDAPKELGLTYGQHLIVSCLLAHDRVCSELLLWKASRRRAEDGCENGSNVVSVQVSHIRRKFEPFGLTVETVKARGYRLPPATRTRLLNWNTQTQQAA